MVIGDRSVAAFGRDVGAAVSRTAQRPAVRRRDLARDADHDMQSGRFAVTSKSMTTSSPCGSRPSSARPRTPISVPISSADAVHVDELTNPGEQDLHSPNCSRKRRSFS